MVRFIDADALKAVFGMGDDCNDCKQDVRSCQFDQVFTKMDICGFIDDAPAADVRPVVRGEWIGYPECLKYPNAYSDDHIVCSACEECFSILDNDCVRFNYCPNCGAKMEVEHDSI